MSVLVYTENWEGKFKKLSFELVSYAKALADKLGTSVTALSIGNVANEELYQLGNYGATKVLNVADSRFEALDNKALAIAVANAAVSPITNVCGVAASNLLKTSRPSVSVPNKCLDPGGTGWGNTSMSNPVMGSYTEEDQTVLRRMG